MTHIGLKQIGQYKPFWAFIIVLVLLHLPTLNRPVSKHHEFNTAVVLINTISWQQAGGGAQFSFTPLMNFQGDANKLIEKGKHVDRFGNHVYLSFGPGWYVIPYFVFKWLHLPATPLSLQWLNIFIGIITCFLLFALAAKMSASLKTGLWLSAFFCLLPAPLWYMGNGYVTTAIMLPLVIYILMKWNDFATDSNSIDAASLFKLMLAGITLTYIDWLTPFLLGGMGFWAMLSTQKSNRHFWLIGACAFSIAAGIVLVLAQFAGYLGWEQVMQYWQLRYSDRGAGDSLQAPTTMALQIITFLIAGAAPLFIVLALKIFSHKRFFDSPKNWILFALGGVLVYNLVFLKWSTEHEFAWMAFFLVLTIFLVPFFHKITNSKYGFVGMGALLLIAVIQYFLINLPGSKTRKGELYAAQQMLGENIKDTITADATILTNLSNEKIVEYYAGRTFNQVKDLQQAMQLTDSLHLKLAVWLEVDHGKIVVVKPLNNQP